MKYILSFVLSWLLIGSAWAQPYGDSKFKQKFNKADALVFDGSYMEALPLLEEMYKFDTVNANLNYLLGVAYMLGKKDYPLAIKRLESSTKDVSLEYSEANWKERKAPGKAYYYLGRAYHFKNQFDRAITNYYNYRSFIEMDDVATYNQVRQQIQYAENAMELIKNPVEVKVTNLGPTINTKYPDYCPVVSADGKVLIFTSRRAGGFSDAKDQDGNYFDDIYICHRQSDGSWSKPKGIGPTINTAGHEAAIGLSPNGQLLFIYKDDNGVGNIYYSEKKGDGWTSPKPMGSNINTNSWETHATVNATEDLLVFVSNRAVGGFGGRDLWYCKRLPDGEWGLAQNMGSVINSQYEEDSPFISADGKTLIFSSQGHTSMGGFDIFRSEFVDGAWTIPENIGYPINTSEDDVFFVLAPDGRTAYYSSKMDGGFGDSDLYKLKLKVQRPDDFAIARGVMKVPAMQYADIHAKIEVTDKTGGKIGTYRPNKNTGYYVLALAPGETYEVSYQADGYNPIVTQLPVTDDEVYAEYDGVLELEDVVFGENILALQKETDRLEKEKEAAAAKAAEDERLAAEAAAQAAEKAKEEAEQLALAEAKEAELKKAEQLAEAEKNDAAKKLAEEQEKARLAEVERKKAEAKARYEAEQAAAQQKEQEEKAKAAQELLAKQKAEEAAREAAEKAQLVEVERKKAEAKARYEAEQAAAQQKEQEEKAKAEQELLAKQKAEEVAHEAAEQAKLAEAQAKLEAEELAAKQQAELASQKAEAEAAAKLAAEQAEAEKLAKQKAQEEAENEEAAKEARAAEMLAAKAAAEELERKNAEELAARKEAAAKELAEKEALEAEQQLAAEKAKELEAQKAEAEAIRLEAEKAELIAIEKKAEEERIAQLAAAAAENRKLELEKRIVELKAQQELQQAQEEAAVAEVKEVSIQKVEPTTEQGGISVDAEAIKAKREAMLKRIEQLKNERANVEDKKEKSKEVVDETSQKLTHAIQEKEAVETEAETKQGEIATLEKELEVVNGKVELAKVKVRNAETEKTEAEGMLQANEDEEQRLAREEEQKAAEALEAERQIKELEEQEQQRLAAESEAAEQFEKQQADEAERTQRELIQMEAIAEQQQQVAAALKAEERKKAAIAAAEKSAFSDAERLANANTLEQLREINEKLIADNLELRKELAELNSKLDQILARMDYQPDIEKVEIPSNSTMKNLEGGKRLILRNIYFDYNLASLRPKSKYELNKLYKFMKDNPDVQIVVSGHTDSKGDDDYNMRLSQERAQAVVDYLVRNGILASRLEARGYGETRPIARNENADKTDNPVGRQLNRRIEINIPSGSEKGVEVEPVNIPAEAQIK